MIGSGIERNLEDSFPDPISAQGGDVTFEGFVYSGLGEKSPSIGGGRGKKRTFLKHRPGGSLSYRKKVVFQCSVD